MCPQTAEALSCLYTILLMAVYWMTEALPLPITSMIPMVSWSIISTVYYLLYNCITSTCTVHHPVSSLATLIQYQRNGGGWVKVVYGRGGQLCLCNIYVHSPYLPYSKGICSQEVAIPLIKVR